MKKKLMKKTLYDLLELAPTATFPEIETAYKRISQYISSSYVSNQEDASNKLKGVKQAYEILSNNTNRHAYDASLAVHSAPQNFNEITKTKKLIKKDSWSLMRGVLTLIATLMALGMAMQVVFMVMAYHRTKEAMGDVDSGMTGRSKAEEKVILQEYYQEKGISASSTTEAEMLEAQQRKEADALRNSEYVKKEQERKYRQFVEESRREGDEVSQNLRRAEEEARRVEAEKQRKLEDEKIMKKKAEDARAENEKNKWHSKLTNDAPYSPSRNDEE